MTNVDVLYVLACDLWRRHVGFVLHKGMLSCVCIQVHFWTHVCFWTHVFLRVHVCLRSACTLYIESGSYRGHEIFAHTHADSTVKLQLKQ